jgi:hypothetical protein
MFKFVILFYSVILLILLMNASIGLYGLYGGTSFINVLSTRRFAPYTGAPNGFQGFQSRLEVDNVL